MRSCGVSSRATPSLDPRLQGLSATGTSAPAAPPSVERSSPISATHSSSSRARSSNRADTTTWLGMGSIPWGCSSSTTSATASLSWQAMLVMAPEPVNGTPAASRTACTLPLAAMPPCMAMKTTAPAAAASSAKSSRVSRRGGMGRASWLPPHSCPTPSMPPATSSPCTSCRTSTACRSRRGRARYDVVASCSARSQESTMVLALGCRAADRGIAHTYSASGRTPLSSTIRRLSSCSSSGKSSSVYPNDSHSLRFLSSAPRRLRSMYPAPGGASRNGSGTMSAY
mmetsp:Transcript_7972/g.17102  ORF Transcript_7972/g.17102 Transcript_7972/m.17102 type:complete len:284 (-) Transcript_7972:200-1051(-)